MFYFYIDTSYFMCYTEYTSLRNTVSRILHSIFIILRRISMDTQHTRFIHCADLHLDSCMESYLSLLQAQNRRKELLQTFSRMADYADSHQVRGILISGDLFDTAQVSRSTVSALFHCIQAHPLIDFLYLPGNHDSGCISRLFINMDLPGNFWLLSSSEITKFRHFHNSADISSSEPVMECDFMNSHTVPDKTYGPVRITGLTGDISELPALSSSQINVVMLHGQIDTYRSDRSTDNCFHYSLKEMSGHNIDYAAAGHIHQYSSGRIDDRGIYCYSGCLEGRGFDECGEKGFVLLDIESDGDGRLRRLDSRFIPFASRYFYDIGIDITEADSYRSIEQQADAVLSAIDSIHLVRLKLNGAISPDLNPHSDWILQKYSEDFYFLRVEDHTRPVFHYEDYRYDSSLRGEFIRLVLSDSDLSEADKEKIILEGLHALSGEEILLNQ
ncbi:MAG: exonuclease SbcCD subunit D [Blautia sp.]